MRWSCATTPGKADVPDDDEAPFRTASGTPPLWPAIGFLYVDPEEPAPEQAEWLLAWLDAFEAKLAAGAGQDRIDVASWDARREELRGGDWATGALLADVEARAATLEEAQARNFARWPILGEPIEELPHTSCPGWEERLTWRDEVDWLEGWLSARLDWLDGAGVPAPRGGWRTRARASSPRLRYPAHLRTIPLQLPPLLRRHPRAFALVGTWAVAAVAIWLRAGARRVDTSDDAFISFRYAWNLVHGHGLTWNRHMDPVEGYSNLAWTLLAALGIGVGAPVAWWAKVWGTALYAGAAVSAAGVVRQVGGSRTSAAMAVVLCCASTIGARWAMAGLETPLLAFCLVAGTWAAVAEDQAVRAGKRPTPWSLAIFGVASITHVEGPLYLGIPAAIRLLRWRVEPLGRRDLVHLALLCAPAAAQVALRLGYYGDILPNTLRAKGLGGADPGRILGLRYLLAGFTYNLPQGLLFAVGGALAMLAGRGALLLPGASVAVFILVADGDDFGELRFFAPAIPSLVAAGVAGFDVLAAKVARARTWGVAVVCAAVLAFELPPQTVKLAITPLQLRPLLEQPGAEAPSWTAGPWANVKRQPWSQILEGDGFVAETEVPWFFAYLIETLPVGASFYFEDVGRVGYALAHNALLDGRGLNWRAAALLDKQGTGDARFQAEFLEAAPVVVSVSCGDVQGHPAVTAILQSAAFQRDYLFIGQGAYFSGAGQVCLWARGDAVPPSWEIVEARYRRLLRDMPGDYDWATALENARGARARR